jgi:2-(3-amino-3-carboxypropyl)histidine synthase
LTRQKKIGAKKLIHYGHCKYGGASKTTGIKVEYRLYPITISLAPLENSLSKLKKYKKLALVTTVSHIHQLNDMKQILQNAGHEVYTSKGSAAMMEGQVLGCDASAASNLANKVDAIIYVGGGEFHPLGISSSKPVLAINPYAHDSYFINENIEKKLKKERGMLIAASQAKTFGIIVSTKYAQFRLMAAENAKKKLRALKKEAHILISSEIDFNSLKDFNSFDAYIATACPRLEDDWERVEKPIISISKLGQLIELIKNTQ